MATVYNHSMYVLPHLTSLWIILQICCRSLYCCQLLYWTTHWFLLLDACGGNMVVCCCLVWTGPLLLAGFASCSKTWKDGEDYLEKLRNIPPGFATHILMVVGLISISFQELACQYSSKSSLCFGKWSSAFLPVSDERKSMKQSTKFDLGVCHSENNFNKITTYFCIVFVLLP